jgi:hypothetical protein
MPRTNPYAHISAEFIPTLRPSDLCSACFFGDIARVKELLFVEPVDEDSPLEGDETFDPTAPADDEAEAEAAERQQQRDANEAEQLKKLSEPGTIISRKTPVDVIECGLGIEVLPHPTEGGKVRGIFVPSRDTANLKNLATPLMWACLAREHEVVEYLISLGADPEKGVPLGKTTTANAKQVCTANHFFETLRIVEACEAKFKEGKEKLQEAKEARKATLKRREELRQETIRKQQEEEEREAAEENAAAEENNDYDEGEEEYAEE